MLLAITHPPSERIEDCQLTYLPRTTIDHRRALRQHEAYCQTLRECGATVLRLDGNSAMPDGAFVEDTAVVLDEVAVLASMGVASRRAETAAVEAELACYREIVRVDAPATLEGGDVLQVGRTLLVGRSPRTNEAGIRAFEALVRPLGYRVVSVGVHGCVHLKTACTALDDATLLLNPHWVPAGALAGFRLVEVDRHEPWAANVVRIGRDLCLAAGHPRTAETIQALGYRVKTVDVSEFSKAEAGPTCLSLLMNLESA